MPVVMTDLIIEHAHGNPPVLPASLAQESAALPSAPSGRVAHVGVAVMCYPDPHIVPAIWAWFCSLICCQEQKKKKKFLELSPAGSAQWGTAPESFYRAKRVQIRWNLPFVADSPPPLRPPSKTFCFSTTNIFQSPGPLSSQFLLFFFLFFWTCKQPGSKSGRQPADVAGPCLQDCSAQRGCVSPVKNLVRRNSNWTGLTGPINDKSHSFMDIMLRVAAAEGSRQESNVAARHEHTCSLCI